MADMAALDDILNDTAASAVPVQNNFQTIETYINGPNLIRTDGTEVMAANLDVDSNKIVNLADGTVAADAVNKGQLDTGIATVQSAVDNLAFATDDLSDYQAGTSTAGLTIPCATGTVTKAISWRFFGDIVHFRVSFEIFSGGLTDGVDTFDGLPFTFVTSSNNRPVFQSLFKVGGYLYVGWAVPMSPYNKLRVIYPESDGTLINLIANGNPTGRTWSAGAEVAVHGSHRATVP